MHTQSEKEKAQEEELNRLLATMYKKEKETPSWSSRGGHPLTVQQLNAFKWIEEQDKYAPYVYHPPIYALPQKKEIQASQIQPPPPPPQKKEEDPLNKLTGDQIHDILKVVTDTPQMRERIRRSEEERRRQEEHRALMERKRREFEEEEEEEKHLIDLSPPQKPPSSYHFQRPPNQRPIAYRNESPPQRPQATWQNQYDQRPPPRYYERRDPPPSPPLYQTRMPNEEHLLDQIEPITPITNEILDLKYNPRFKIIYNWYHDQIQRGAQRVNFNNQQQLEDLNYLINHYQAKAMLNLFQDFPKLFPDCYQKATEIFNKIFQKDFTGRVIPLQENRKRLFAAGPRDKLYIKCIFKMLDELVQTFLNQEMFHDDPVPMQRVKTFENSEF